MPPQFSYSPYIPPKRINTRRTATSVITQVASAIIHGDGTIDWTVQGGYPEEFQALYDLYNSTPTTTRVFVGYWGDSYTVRMTTMDPPKVQGRLFDFGGQFQVEAVITPIAAEC